ncbi:FAD/NAD(P)-binding protein [Streptomyces sp. NPDC026589]|uniref:FAD/NAD(P)-binding protein n=1 Tax=Streptomyces sp. NPDC026589 TaxID=3155609 RepID=UPI003400FB75
MSTVPSVVVIGGGPRGTGVIERIAANAGELYGSQRLDIHLVDPYPAGGGRIWRPDQSPLLWMNSMAEDVTMFTDETVDLAGPVVTGPALDAWAEDVRAGRVVPSADPAVVAEIHGLAGADFPSRRLQSAYLRWTYDRALAALPPGITVHEHRTTALAVTGPRGGRQRVRLQDRAEPLPADLVVLTVGHLDAEKEPEQERLSAFARRHDLVHLPPDFTADSDLDALRPGEPVIVRGFGLAFIDLMVLLTEGRGGRHENGVYLPSGREPVLYVGSRRGVPYHAKIGYGWTGERPPPLRLGQAWAEELLSRPGPLDFRRDVWPAVAKELGHAHYHRLFTAHPERTALAHEVFAEKYAAADPDSPELAGLIAEAVPDPADRLDLDALDRPLDGVRHASPEALQEALRDHITADLTRRHDPSRSEDLAVFLGLLTAYAQLVRLGDIGGWWHGFFSYLASGPPGPRLQQLLALSRAGVVRFLGAGLTVETDEEHGLFRATGATLPGAHTEARALVEARLPDPSLRHTASPLLRALRDEGAAVTDTGLLSVDPADSRVLDRAGRPHPRRFALGPFTTARNSGAFTRPRTGGPAFRQNDAAARAALTFLRDLSCRGLLAS